MCFCAAPPARPPARASPRPARAADTTYICANGPVPAGCETTTNDDGSPDTNSGLPGPGFQSCGGANCVNGPFCKRLGDSAANVVVAPLFAPAAGAPPQRDNRLYARGVQLNYTGGNVCRSQSGLWLPRILSFNYICYEGPSAYNPPLPIVAESTNCVYDIFVYSRFGCPSQCFRFLGDPPCNGAGVCGYDATNRKAKCFCNENFGGPYCESAAVSTAAPLASWAGNIAGAFIGGLAVGALAVLGYNLFAAVRAGGSWSDWRAAIALEKLFAPGGGKAGGGSPYAYVKPEAAAGGEGGGAGAAFAGSTEAPYRPPEADL